MVGGSTQRDFRHYKIFKFSLTWRTELEVIKGFTKTYKRNVVLEVWETRQWTKRNPESERRGKCMSHTVVVRDFHGTTKRIENKKEGRQRGWKWPDWGQINKDSESVNKGPEKEKRGCHRVHIEIVTQIIIVQSERKWYNAPRPSVPLKFKY